MPIEAPPNPFITVPTINLGWSVSATSLVLQPGPGAPPVSLNNTAGLWVNGDMALEAIHAETSASNGAGAVSGYALSETGSTSGVYGESEAFDGVHGVSHSTQHAGVAGINESGGPNAFGVWAKGSPAGHFEGDVSITGTLTVGADIVLNSADCAEEFDVSEDAMPEPGTVMVLNQDGKTGPSSSPYDKRVVGVISGAGDYRPALIMDRQKTAVERVPIALVGKVFCKVDATYAPVEVGDLLTTSPTAGHAMRVTDPLQAFGSVIGKALRPLRKGQGLVPVLIALQ